MAEPNSKKGKAGKNKGIIELTDRISESIEEDLTPNGPSRKSHDKQNPALAHADCTCLDKDPNKFDNCKKCTPKGLLNDL